MALAEDVSSPGGFTGTGNSPASITTSSFSPPAASLVVALVSGESSAGAMAATVSDNSGLITHTWRQVAAATGGPWGGLATVWISYIAAAPGSITVTANFTGLGGGRLLDVRVITGADPTQNVSQGWAAAYTTLGITTGAQTLNTTVSGSMVYGLSNCPNMQVTGTRWDTNTTLLTTDGNTTDNTEAISWKQTSVTGSTGSVVRGVTWASSGAAGNVASFEIMPSGFTPGSPTIPTFIDGSVPHASDLNTINTNISNLFKILQGGVRYQAYAAGGQGPRKPICVLTCANPTITIGTGGNNVVTFDTALVNSDNSWSPMNNVFLVGRTGGLWRFHFAAQIVGQATVGEIEAAILFNGVTYPTNVVASTNANGTAIGVSATVQVSGGGFVLFQLNSPTSSGTIGFATAVGEWLSP